ncbi:histidine kinase [Streptomyces sp. NPDC001941]|uniref:sensor histidine kinase n=1 Tax=Streptomyces sp. NPDC001941 TaxID=3154659 RepID=UPI003321D4F6
MRWRAPRWLCDAGLVFLSAAEFLAVRQQARPLEAACYALAVAALGPRRRWPVAAALATVPAAAHGYLWLAPMLALYNLAGRNGNLLVVYGCAAVTFLAGVVPASWAEVQGRGNDLSEWVGLVLGAALFSAGPVMLGRLVGMRRELAARIAELDASRAQERRAAAERAVVLERARLARDMHDGISHQVSLMAVEAGVLAVTTKDPEARRSAERVGELGRRTMDELRDLLGVLRGAGAPERPPGLADLPALIAASGLPVRADQCFPAAAPDPATQYAAYRIVQEALTNAAKHAPGSAITVKVRGDDRTGLLRVEVVNCAPPRGGSPVGARGHGLTGLRERAALVGGSLSAAPTGDGGFAVRAVLPYGPTRH